MGAQKQSSVTKISQIIKLAGKKSHDTQLAFNNHCTYFAVDRTIQELFEEQVRSTPDSMAVVYQDERLTYKELNERSNRLARYLRETYVIQPDEPVCLFLERDEHMVISILAVLKAGGGYVPIDPAHPDERICFILSDTRTRVILCNEAHSSRLKELTIPLDTKVATIDSPLLLSELQTSHSGDNIVSVNTSADLAYVIYTSGTTGNPKGVMVEHRNVLRLFKATADLFRFTDQDTWVLFHSYAFDFSVWEMWGALLYGGRLYVPQPEETRDPEVFYDKCLSLGVTVLNQTPTAFYQFSTIAVNRSSKLTRLRYVIFGGEALNLGQLRRWFSKYDEAAPRLINMYGITETTVHVTYKVIQPADLEYGSLIGKPLADLTAYVLDDQGGLLPPGAVGELYIGGSGVARGYLNRPELTTERFILNPFQGDAEKNSGFNGRLYKTGDLVRWLSDGSLEYIGRNDFQVKIRGYRIELGEIESRLAQYPGIDQVAVLAREQPSSGNKYLVGYYVSPTAITHEVLQEYLEGFLPDYMLPATYVRMERFPLTANGKLDSRALPDPEFTGQREYQAPRNGLEKQLCRIYAEVLGLDVDKISVTDDFFKLGGDSIVAIRLVSRINDALAIRIRVRDVFEKKSVGSIAQHILKMPLMDTGAKAEENSYMPFSLINKDKYAGIIDFDAIDDIYPAGYLQMGMLFESETNSSNYHNIAVYRIDDHFDDDKFVKIWDILIGKHELLRAAFITSDNGYDCIIYKSVHIDIAVLENIDVRTFISQERLNSFDITRPGLVRLFVNKLKDQFDLVFSGHHVIEDGWSMASLINEFIGAYSRGTAITQKANQLSYARFVSKEMAIIRDDSAGDFWREYLSDHVFNRVNWKQQGASSGNGLVVSVFDLDQENNAKVNLLARSLQIHSDSIFLYAYLYALSRFLNCTDLVVGLVVNNRLEQQGGDELFGLFLNTIPLRYRLDDQRSGREAIADLFDQKMALYDYKAYPYGKIKSLAGRELFQFAFNFVHFHILRESKNNIVATSGYGRTDIPFQLNVFQRHDDSFIISIKAHDEVADQWSLDYFLTYYRFYLENLLDSKKESIAPLMPSDHEQVVHRWNSTRHPYPFDKTLTGLFEEQVELVADQVAVVYEEQRLSYGELNARANQLAWYLRQEYAVQPEDLVCLFVDRSEHMLIAILGVLKAGAAYVPIDPEFPDERVGYILSDTRARVVLTNDEHRPRLKELTSSLNTNIEAIDSPLLLTKLETNYSKQNLPSLTGPTNLAYVIYTSGTTGMPKGVMVEHKSVVNFICSYQSAYSDKRGQLAGITLCPYVFDVSGLDFFYNLCSGNTLFIVSSYVAREPGLIAKCIIDNKINVAYIPAGLLTDIADYFEVSDPRVHLSLLLVGVSPIKQKVLQRFYKTIPGITIINEYGPTETTIFSTTYTYSHLSDPEQNVPMGKPIFNSACYVLDENKELLPIGAIGELYLGGVGVARGYFNRPELTAERFIANPYQTEVEKQEGYNGRLYKTGDMVRWLADGNLEFIGRNDFQVKVRGYRIELGEIESRLLSYPGINHAVVLARDHPSTDNKYLVGYYVSTTELTRELLDKYLSGFLPDYMIPAIYVRMDRLPLTINGKPDRLALPVPDFISNQQYEAPGNELERELCKIYGEVLGLDGNRISVTDDFFHLGGDSILAIKLIGKIKAVYNSSLKIRDVFANSRIRQLAKLLLTREDGNTVTAKYVELEAESKMDLSFAEIGRLPKFSNIPEGILLTGSTGFVGAYVINELLEHTSASIYCLVRGKDIKEGMHRISKNFHHYFGRDIGCPDRILPIPGDFSQPNLGTPLEQYEQLCREVDYVYHLGAHINFFSTYDQLKSGNVDSNIGLIRFATTAKLKKIIYTSTTSIFSDLSRPRYENDPIENERHLFLSGYTSSKWVGEKMMLTAMENGVPIQLFRLGLTTGDNQRGVLPQNQWLTKLLETCAIVGYFPMHQSLSVAPVDFVARSLAHLSLDRHYCPGLYHLTSPEQTDLSYFFDEQSGEKRAKGIPLQEWVEKIIAISKDQPLPILPFIEMINKDVHGQLADKPKKYPISSDFTLSKLKELGIEYSFDVRSIQSYLNKYVNI